MSMESSEEKIILALDGLNTNEILSFLNNCPQNKMGQSWLRTILQRRPCDYKDIKKNGKKDFFRS